MIKIKLLYNLQLKNFVSRSAIERLMGFGMDFMTFHRHSNINSR